MITANYWRVYDKSCQWWWRSQKYLLPHKRQLLFSFLSFQQLRRKRSFSEYNWTPYIWFPVFSDRNPIFRIQGNLLIFRKTRVSKLFHDEPFNDMGSYRDERIWPRKLSQELCGRRTVLLFRQASDMFYYIASYGCIIVIVVSPQSVGVGRCWVWYLNIPITLKPFHYHW
jgi:hypothetical protein